MDKKTQRLFFLDISVLRSSKSKREIFRMMSVCRSNMQCSRNERTDFNQMCFKNPQEKNVVLYISGFIVIFFITPNFGVSSIKKTKTKNT